MGQEQYIPYTFLWYLFVSRLAEYHANHGDATRYNTLIDYIEERLKRKVSALGKAVEQIPKQNVRGFLIVDPFDTHRFNMELREKELIPYGTGN